MEPYAQLRKWDEFQGIATGVIACEEPDHDGEILDYNGSKDYFKQWSAQQNANSQGKSFGNLRLQHDPKRIVGSVISPLEFDDTNKRIMVSAKVIDPIAKELLNAGALTGFSIGGDYVSKKPLMNGLVRYIARPQEVSICDRPCSPSAVFSSVKSDGSTELRKFQKVFTGDMLLNKALNLMKCGFSEQDVAWTLQMTPGAIYLAKSQDPGFRLNASNMREERRRRIETNPYSG
jgi:hypothetical protein